MKALVYRAFGDPLARLALEQAPEPAIDPTQLRVAMIAAPVNPSDLIPITGAYSHRIALPAVAGYEGVGRVVHAPPSHAHWLGRRVLPLRAGGTWQSCLDCAPDLAIPVPDGIDDLLAARAYINPLAAMCLLEAFAPVGKRVLLSGAGSACSELLGQWAHRLGARQVQGLYRSPSRIRRLLACGIEPVCMDDLQAVDAAASVADLTFDALGGLVGSRVLDRMGEDSTFVGYGLLSGQGLRPSRRPRALYRRFHLRDCLARMDSATWHHQFASLWKRLRDSDLPPVREFWFDDWRAAIEHAARPGAEKAMLRFSGQVPQLQACTGDG